jgi:RNA polymerase sigma-70 factor (ECF subfamily)
MTLHSPLLVRVAAGDTAARRECVDAFGPLVWALARKFSPSDADAEDAVQEIFISLLDSAPRFDPTRSSEAGFVAMIARRRLIDQLRKRRPHVPFVDDDHAYQPHVFSAGRLESQRIESSFSGLKPDQQRVLWMAAVEGFSQVEIAEQTGLPLGTVKAHARRGLEKLRALFFGPSSDGARTRQRVADARMEAES